MSGRLVSHNLPHRQKGTGDRNAGCSYSGYHKEVGHRSSRKAEGKPDGRIAMYKVPDMVHMVQSKVAGSVHVDRLDDIEPCIPLHTGGFRNMQHHMYAHNRADARMGG